MSTSLENKPPVITANGEQRTAADPTASVWVSANAGSGKTHVLTDRVTRLLLDGTEPGRILCLTFTKAAAAEMASRLFDRLGKWALLSDEDLDAALIGLEGAAPTLEKRLFARRLFARALETPGGLKIQTIHAFCERLLGRFPLEAGVAPHFEILDERSAAELMGEARDHILNESTEQEAELAAALDLVVSLIDEQSFDDLIWEITNHRARFADLLQHYGDVDTVAAEIWQTLGCSQGQTADGLVEDACRAAPFPMLREAAAVLAQGSKTDQTRASALSGFLESDAPVGAFDLYTEIFLTQKQEPRKSLMTKKLAEAHSALNEALGEEQKRIVALTGQLKSLHVAEASQAVLILADALLDRFATLKARHSVLDYEDLIAKSRALLQQTDMAAWVLYKLDGGLDHILVDEAQDTSPDQWQIIQKLTEEFFSGAGATSGEKPRTLFAVGDEKQSIYSFQGAAPDQFDAMRRYFGERISQAGLRFSPVPLLLSFRSTRDVLQSVDKIFAEPPARQGLSATDEQVAHEPFRQNAAGLVEIWEPEAPDEEAAHDPWDAPLDYVSAASPPAKLATRIAETIGRWLKNGETIAATGRQITPGDIVILVRRRTAFAEEMIRALKLRDIPVAGTDRMVLTDQLAVMDLMALGRFCLLPEDDLNLAAVLKSPLIGLDEDALFDLAYGRTGALWSALERRRPERADFTAAYDFLFGLRSLADHKPPYEFYAELLGAKGGRRNLIARLGVDANDPIDEFLSLCLEFERSHPPSLQAFLHWVEEGQTIIKRDMDHGRNEVRVMTVHGAKGLEADIVFLPDTCTVPGGRHDPKLILTDHPKPFLLWPVRKIFDDDQTARARERLRKERIDEYHRLLYVALTRAKDRLYVCGYQTKQGRDKDCWYDLITNALLPEAHVTQEEGRTLWRIESPQQKPPRAQPTKTQAARAPLPDWAGTPAPAEPVAQRPLSPSRLTDQQTQETPIDIALSPLAGEGRDPYKRGRLIHRLLQTLPDMKPHDRPDAAARFLAAPSFELREADQKEIAEAVSGVMSEPAFAPLFGPGSRAEVALTGPLPGQPGSGAPLVSGQIDRLLIAADHIFIIDYKTNRPAPGSLDKIPAAYVTQMAAYRAILSQIYPDRPVKAALLWTDGPALMVLPNLLLDKALPVF